MQQKPEEAAGTLMDFITHDPRLQVDLIEEQQWPNAGLPLDGVVVGSTPFGSESTFSFKSAFHFSNLQ